MEPCHSVLPPIGKLVPHPPPYHRHLPAKIYSTLGHLVDILEQLASTEDLSTVLSSILAENDDARRPACAQGLPHLDLDPATIIRVAQVLRKRANMATDHVTSGTKVASSANLGDVSGETPGKGGERALQRAIDGRNMYLSKQDSLYLMKKIKDFEQKCKPLQEKNKKFLEKNMELTTLNRNLKEQIHNITDENKKMKDHLDQCRRKCSSLSQQLKQEKIEKGCLEVEIQELRKLRDQVTEQNTTITNLKQACAEKDRRMEVLQHRKKRRLRMSAEHLSRLSSPCSAVDEERSLDSSDLSQSSISGGTMSDEELLEELPHDDIERLEKSYKKLMKEHLALQKSMAQLQGLLGCRADPQRYLKMKTDYETDLYVAHCKIENLEECLEKYQDSDCSWVKEKDELCEDNRLLSDKVDKLNSSLREITQAHEDSQEQIENLEFLILETQECNKVDKPPTCDVCIATDPSNDGHGNSQYEANELESLRASEGSLRDQLKMSEGLQEEYRGAIKGLEEKLAGLLQGQGSEVTEAVEKLKQSQQHVTEVESTMQELQTKIVSLQREKAGLADQLTQYRVRLDSQEHSLALTRDEREELLQVKPNSSDHLNSRLRLAEMGRDRICKRSSEYLESPLPSPGRDRLRERSSEYTDSPIPSPRTPRRPFDMSEPLLSISYQDNICEDIIVPTVGNNETQTVPSFDNRVSSTPVKETYEPFNFDCQTPQRSRLHSVPNLRCGETHYHSDDAQSEVDRLQKQISELKEENDVLRFELMQKGSGDSDASGSDSEDLRIVELREMCEQLRERVHNAEISEKQYKDRIKLAEKHITELELSESVMRDRVDEGNADCDKLRKQIVRLQRKIRELKDIASEKDICEQSLVEKVKYLEENEAALSQKITDLEGTNYILKQRIDLKEDLLTDVHLVATLEEKVAKLEAQNKELEAKVFDLEEDGEILRDNWTKVAEEEANRRESLEEKIRVLQNAKKDLKAKLKELQDSDLDVSSGPSIASEINEDVIEQLNERIRELENELHNLSEEKNQKIESLQENLDRMRETELKLSETIIEMESTEKQLKDHISVLEKSENSQEAACRMLSYEGKIKKLQSSQENLLDRMDSMENHEEDLKQRMIEMEKMHEKKLEMLEREIAEYQQQEDDLCARIEEFEENEIKLNKKIEQFVANEVLFKNKIEELETVEINLTVRFSQRVEELENNEKEANEKFYQTVEEFEKKETELCEKVSKLETEKGELNKKLVAMEEKHEKELSEKVTMLQTGNINQNTDSGLALKDQENSDLLLVGSKSNGTTLEVRDKFESFATIEKESYSKLSMSAQDEINNESLIRNNLCLQEEISKLTLRLQEHEKEHKALEDKFKKQEKKRKKSQRTDNLEDYDTLAREVVTYKMEVDQLRTENTDLHERVMELDESEKTLLEQNEKLQMSLEMSSITNTNDQDQESQHEQELNELKSKITCLQNEISVLQNANVVQHIRQPSEDSAYDSGRDAVKETCDKTVGTDDFMEGVMVGQEQGKPVSSMFVRIQSLEQENQDLSTALSSLTATDSQVRQLSEKVKSLEENEDSLMERVMELEDEEDRLKRELVKSKKSLTAVSDLEDKLCSLQDTEKELSSTIEQLELENSTLKRSAGSSHVEKGDIAIRLAAVQKKYEDEKKKVESLLKGEERWMKSVSSEKRAVKEIEEELANTQEKLEELQTEYENKLTVKDECEKLIKNELNKTVREKQMLSKKLQEYEKSNSELEDEIESCKISESRMFHKHQQLITQNQELELKLSKLLQVLPQAGNSTIHDNTDGQERSDHAMAENPELISENPLTSSIFTETELELLRSKTPDTELLGSVPLDMLRKIQEFDKREGNYQSKVQDLENKCLKLSRKVKILQGREKDLKHEIKELQVELMNYRESTSSLRASTSSLDIEKSGSEDGLDSDSQSLEGFGEHNSDIFRSDEKLNGHYEHMGREQLLLSVKLFEEKQAQDGKKLADLEVWMASLMLLLQQVGSIVVLEPLEDYHQNVGSFKEKLNEQKSSEDICGPLLELLESVSCLKQTIQALQNAEAKLRVSLAEKEIVTERLRSESTEKIAQLEAQIQVLAKLSDKYPPTADVISPETSSITQATAPTSPAQKVETHDRFTSPVADLQQEVETQNRVTSPIKDLQPETHNRFTSPIRDLCLEISKTINVDVLPSGQRRSEICYLGQSETVSVDVPPTGLDEDSANEYVSERLGHKDDVSESFRMMDKAEDVLRQRIRELEKLDKHLKQQVLDLELDRDELHEIARKDKNIIHDQNVQIRELQLSQRNLQEQVRMFEASENSLYARLDEIENEMENKDDKIRQLEVLENRLKDLVKQYKLDEKILVTKSATLESSVSEMSVKEDTLRQKVQNLESEKFAFSERSEYLQMRLKELEHAEVDLAQRTKNQDTVVQSLQGNVIELETFGANAHARVVELEQINFELQQRLHHSMVENSPLSKQASDLQEKCESMKSELVTLREAEIGLKQENSALLRSEAGLQQELKALQLQAVELDAKVRDLAEAETVLKDRCSKLQRSENTLRYRVQELENSGIQAPSDLTVGQQEKMKLPRTLEDCQRRVIMLQANNAELQSRVQQYQNISGTSEGAVPAGGTRGLVPVPQAEYQALQRKAAVLEQTEQQMEQVDRLNSHLRQTVDELREGKDVCGHEVEMGVLQKRLEQANKSVKMLQDPNSGQWVSQGPNVTMTGNHVSPGRENLIRDLVNNIPGEAGSQQEWLVPSKGTAQETMVKSTTGGEVQSRPPGQMMSRDQMMDDLLASLQAGGPQNSEDDHWREIESRPEMISRGSEQWINVGKATSLYADGRSRSHGKHRNKDEELEIALALASETESQMNSQNDMDSSHRNGVSVSPRIQQRPRSEPYARMNGAPPLPEAGPPREGVIAGSFVDSLYIPSSTQDSIEEFSDQKEVLLRQGGVQGRTQHGAHTSAPSIVDSIADSGRGTASVSMGTSSLTLTQKIARIEKQLSARESDSAREFNSEIDLTSWKAKAHESNRKFELAEKENKALKDEPLRTRPAYRRKLKINKLEKDLEDKTRLYLLLEAFLTSVETILKDKNIGDEERVKRMVTEVDQVRSNMTNSGHRPSDISQDTAALSSELAKKNRELTAKRNEVDSLMQELRQWQQECRTIEDMRVTALDSLRGLEVEISELQGADSQLKSLKDEYNTLRGQFMKLVDAYKNLQIIRQKHDDISQERDELDIEVAGLRSKVSLLEGQIEVLKGVNQENSDLEEKIGDLRENLLEYEKVEIEKNSLEKNVQGIKELLNERMKKVEALTEETFELRKKMSVTEQENYKLRQQTVAPSNSSMSSTTPRIGEGDGKKPKSPLPTAALKSRIVQLTNMCNEKDILIKKLVQELKRMKAGSKPSPLMEELCRLSVNSDHNHNLMSRTSSQSSLDSTGEHVSYVSDTELLRDSSPKHTARPHSADLHHHRNARNHHSHQHSSSNLPRIYANRKTVVPSSQQHHGMMLDNDHVNSVHHVPHRPHSAPHGVNGTSAVNDHVIYVAIADYDPSMFSQSGHQRLELSLKEGDVVTVTGDVDASGYYEGEVGGRVGLVPASHIQPAPRRRAGTQHVVPHHLNASPEMIGQMYSHLRGAHQPDRHVPFNGLSEEECQQIMQEVSTFNKMKLPQTQAFDNVSKEERKDEPQSDGKHDDGKGVPHPARRGVNSRSLELPSNTKFIPTVNEQPLQAATNFHVDKIIGNSSLMLAWQQYPLDNQGCSNGYKVTGFRIYKNGKVLAPARGPRATKAIIENIDIHHRHRFGIQTLSECGHVSELSEVMYEGVEEVTSDENSDTESEMDMSTVLDMDEYKTGAKRTFMGVYDYDPTKNSPQDHPSCELAFNAGDVIAVYGRQRADGFYHGEINGNRGLVPAFFIEEVPQPPPRTKKNAAKTKQTKDSKQKEKQER